MFQDNPLLSQLKQQIRENKPRVEGIIKAHEKGFGFLESDKKSYFIAPPAMKNVIHGDKVIAVIESNEDKESAVPEKLVETTLSRFIGKIKLNKKNKLQVISDHNNINIEINIASVENISQELQANDWVVAELTQHGLRDDKPFAAKITEFICHGDDRFAPWWITLARHQQPREPIPSDETYTLNDNASIVRHDLCHLDFVTIDSESTQDMDDALYVEKQIHGWKLWVAIADPTAYIEENSRIDLAAKARCFTYYLPNFNVPMLPRELSDELCSLVPHQKRPALVCEIVIDEQGNVTQPANFLCAWIESKAKLDYQKVSDFIEQKADGWQPEQPFIAEQIHYLHQFALARIHWRKHNALIFKDKPDYSFELTADGEVSAIYARYRRIANQIVEECMILANIVVADYLNNTTGYGIFNTHNGFDPRYLTNAQDFLNKQLSESNSSLDTINLFNSERLASFEGFCDMRRYIEQHPQVNYLDMRLRRFLTFAEVKTTMQPHFGLGITGYATWTSPIRKYSDMVNHRIIKHHLFNTEVTAPDEALLNRIQEARKSNRMVEREISESLYLRFFSQEIDKKPIYDAEIIDINRGGIKAQLIENGATVFIPLSSIHDDKEAINVNIDEIALYVNDSKQYQLSNIVKVQLIEVNNNSRSIIANIVIE